MKKIGLILGGLIIVYAGWLLLSNLNRGGTEVYIVPDNFEGCVIVLFDEPEGEPEEYNNEGYRVYRIPEEGVLKTRFKKKEGWRDIVYQRSNGEQIRYLWPADFVWKDTANENSIYKDSVYAYGGGSSNDYWFIIGNAQDSRYWAKKMIKKWEPYSDNIVLRQGDSTGKVRHNEMFDK